MTEDLNYFHTFLAVGFGFCGFLGQECFGSTDADVNYEAMILHTLHTSTQDLSFQKKKKEEDDFKKCRLKI